MEEQILSETSSKALPDKLTSLKNLFQKHSFWIVIVCLLLAGMVLTAYTLWNFYHSGKEEAKKK